MKRLKSFLAWIGFLILLLPALPHNGEGQIPIYVHPRDEPTLMLLSYATPPIYETWWKEIAQCEGMSLPPQHKMVAFVAVNAREFGTFTIWDGISTIGYTDIPSNTIYVAFPYLLDKVILEHEFIHLLQLWNGEPVGHSAKQYGVGTVGKCGVYPFRREGIDDR